ncbi:MAG: lytic transglycosylase domain-containing protein, partial [Armatimonadota bacterium]
MLRSLSRVIVFAVLSLLSVAAVAAVSPADKYLSLRKSLHAITLADVSVDPSFYIGGTVELAGTVSGIMQCGSETSFVLNCGGESLVVQGKVLPSCITNGNTIRVLATIGPSCMAGLSDLQFAAAEYEYDVAKREQELAKPVKRDVDPRSIRPTRANATLSSRAMQVYDPYKEAIRRFNPKLSAGQLDTITGNILAYSEQYGVDPRLVVAVFLVESGFKPTATSPCGAMGLGQLMPGTAQGLGVQNAYDPKQNIEASVRLISGHLGKYDDLSLALAAYNAGPGAVKKYNGVPPYRETR